MPTERPRQFKFRLSDGEWEKLLIVAEVEDVPAADVMRAFIERRYDEVMRPEVEEWYAISDTLLQLARLVRALAKRPPAPG